MTPAPKKAPSPEQQLAASMDNLRGTIEQLPVQYGYYLHPGKHLLFTYLKGILSGLGAITAVAIVVPLILSMLRGVAWVPLVGDFVARVSHQVEQSH